MFELPSLPIIKSLPEQAFEVLNEEVKRFQDALSDEMETGITARGSVIHIGRVSLNGQLLIFDGVDDNDNPARLIQHYSQIQIQITAVPKLAEKPRRIGF